MKNAKVILIVLAILLAAIVAWVVVGVVMSIAKVVLVLALIIFGVSIFRKLAGKSKPQQLSQNDGDRELNETLRQLEELKRSQQLTK